MRQRSIKNILLELTAICSDTGTDGEADAAHRIFRLIRENEYFRTHPDHCGLYGVDQDPLGRPVVWGLRKGSSKRTMILNGHYDTAQTGCYEKFQPYAHNPVLFRQELKKEASRWKADGKRAIHCEGASPLNEGASPLNEGASPLNEGASSLNEGALHDVEDEDWLFGRGIADMKAGLAAGLSLLFSGVPQEVNLLFTAVCDGEGGSAGTLAAVSCYRQLQAAFDLDYRLAVILKPQRHTGQDDPFRIYTGSVGRLSPVIAVRGEHSAGRDETETVTAASLSCEIIRQTMLHPKLSIQSLQMATPLSQQFAGPGAPHSSPSVPERSWAGFDLVIGEGDSGEETYAHLLDTCHLAAEEIASRRLRSGLVRQSDDPQAPTVFSLSQLERLLGQNLPDFPAWKRSQEKEMEKRVLQVDWSLRRAVAAYLFAALEALEAAGYTDAQRRPGKAAAAVSLIPPYRPPVEVSRCRSRVAAYLAAAKNAAESLPVSRIQEAGVFETTADTSFFSCPNVAAERQLAAEIVQPLPVYELPFDEMAELDIPTLIVGPRGRDFHRWTERVYLPDVETTLPGILNAILQRLSLE